jgi:hypothetical protein
MAYLRAEWTLEDSGEGFWYGLRGFRMDSSRTWSWPKEEDDELKNQDSTRFLYFFIPSVLQVSVYKIEIITSVLQVSVCKIAIRSFRACSRRAVPPLLI